MKFQYTLAECIERRSVLVPWSGCRLWLAACTRAGYGLFSFKGKLMYAHRAAWLVANGELPAGMLVCHRCDIPSCINPDHLFLGTCLDNSRDAVRKDRDAHGERHGNAVLTAEQVRAIRADQRSSRVTADEYGIASSTVRRIRRGVDWARVQ